MPGAPTLSEIERTLDGILKPLRDQLAVIDAEIAVLDQRKAELREVRGRVSRLIGANNKPGPKPKPAPTRKGQRSIGVAPERIDALDEFLHAHFNNGTEFHTVMLEERKDLPANFRGPALNKALQALHERGSVRLIRSGGVEGIGNRVKVWAVSKRG